MFCVARSIDHVMKPMHDAYARRQSKSVYIIHVSVKRTWLCRNRVAVGELREPYITMHARTGLPGLAHRLASSSRIITNILALVLHCDDFQTFTPCMDLLWNTS